MIDAVKNMDCLEVIRMTAVECYYEQCYYNVNRRCGIKHYVTVPDGLVQIPVYCPYNISKEKED